MRPSLSIALVLAGLLAGCGSTPAPPSTPGAAPSPPSAKAALAAEQRRLAELFRGTPVVFALEPDGSLRVEVPLRYCFDSVRAEVKPPLAAVLDRVAASQRRERTRLLVTAPADPGAKGLRLATERAVSTRDYLMGRGIAGTRFSISSLAGGGVVKLVVADTSAL